VTKATNPPRKARDGVRRRCIVTGAEKPALEMIRFVLDPDGQVVADVDEKLPGRGFWLSPERDVVNTAVAKRAFAKAAKAKATAPEDLADRVEALLAARCRRLIGLARRAGDAVAGLEQVREGLSAGRAGVALLAADAAPDSARKMSALTRGVPVIEGLAAAELAEAFGRERTVHVLIAPGNLAEALRRTAAKLAGFRNRPAEEGGRDE
jgi:predicted RNA-binding protein YlxR (DUF448 family)